MCYTSSFNFKCLAQSTCMINTNLVVFRRIAKSRHCIFRRIAKSRHCIFLLIWTLGEDHVIASEFFQSVLVLVNIIESFKSYNLGLEEENWQFTSFYITLIPAQWFLRQLKMYMLTDIQTNEKTAWRTGGRQTTSDQKSSLLVHIR